MPRSRWRITENDGDLRWYFPSFPPYSHQLGHDRNAVQARAQTLGNELAANLILAIVMAVPDVMAGIAAPWETEAICHLLTNDFCASQNRS